MSAAFAGRYQGDGMPDRSVIFRDIGDELGSRPLGSALSADGRLAIDGHDWSKRQNGKRFGIIYPHL